MPTVALHQATPKPSCGKTRTLSGSVLAKAEGPSKRKARRRAEEQAIRAATGKINAAWKAKCPKSCGPGTGRGGEVPTIVDLQCVKLDSKRWLAYVTGYWSVAITCPKR